MVETTSLAPEPATTFAEDGTDLTLVRWALALTPQERLQAFEDLMADVVVLLGASDGT